MEVNGFLSHGFRVLSNREAGKNEPEILTHAAEIDLPGLDKAKVLELKLAGNKDAELYKMLLIAQCNELNRAMPFLFERINDETEILLPDNLLASDSVIRKMAAAIEEADWAEVEIIGWLYQFYISEKKDEVIGKTVKSEDIPAATQLFTPNWIVKYMTQNSLGRLWLEANPHSQLAQNMEFYIKPAEENTAASSGSNVNPEEIKVLDPACGSGHILVEAYELLKVIYTERGYSSRDIPLLILEFPADDDGIVPVTDIEWFPQEAARQFEKFVRVVWGEANLNQNLRWIAEQLGGKQSETPIETVRRYFSTSFFKDHLQTYKKRPIYWLFSSGKQKAFEALVYLHRYNESTLPRMRHEYVLPLMSKLTAQIETLDSLKDSAATTSERSKLQKQLEVLQKKQTELAQFDEKLRHYSDMRISLDLDDGVKVNYGKFGDLLAEVKQVATTKE
jgi:hypothetical protein